jgi:hypothetical protein
MPSEVSSMAFFPNQLARSSEMIWRGLDPFIDFLLCDGNFLSGSICDHGTQQ